MSQRELRESESLSELSLRYAGESPFWETLGIRLRASNERELPSLFDALDNRASMLELPLTFGGPKSEAWALVCRIFKLYNNRMPRLGRREYLAMTSGSKRVIQPRFTAAAFKRIAANIAYPSSPGRTVPDSLADTFLVNGLVLTEGYQGPSMDDGIVAAMLGDDEMMDLARKVVTPPEGIWEEARLSYGSNRPGFLTRAVLKFYYWIFDP